VVHVESFGILKQLGLQKPGWLPDFGKSRRKMLIERFFGPIDRATYEDLLADDFVMRDEQDSTATFTRQGTQKFNEPTQSVPTRLVCNSIFLPTQIGLTSCANAFIQRFLTTHGRQQQMGLSQQMGMPLWS